MACYSSEKQLPTRQGSSKVCRIRTWRWEDDLHWALMKVFRTSFYVLASVERNSYVRFERDVEAASYLRLRRIRTSGKLSYGPKAGRPLNVRGRLAEWVTSHRYFCLRVKQKKNRTVAVYDLSLCLTKQRDDVALMCYLKNN